MRDEKLMKLIEKIYTMNAVEAVLFLNEMIDEKIISEQSKEESIQTLLTRSKNISDEIEELKEAIEGYDYNEQVDALMDVFVFAAGGLYNLSENTYSPSVIEVKNVKDAYKSLMEMNEISMSTQGFSNYFKACIDIVVAVCKNIDVNLERNIQEVIISNMTKFMFDYEDMIETTKKYSELGVSTYLRMFECAKVEEPFWYAVIYSTKEQFDIDGKAYRLDKMLKSTKFKAPTIV